MYDSVYFIWNNVQAQKTTGQRPKDDWMPHTATAYWKWNIGAYMSAILSVWTKGFAEWFEPLEMNFHLDNAANFNCMVNIVA